MAQIKKPGRKRSPDAAPLPLWAQALIRARELREMSQVALAEEVGVSQSTVADWETGRTVPRPAAWKRVAAYLGLDPAILFKDPIAPSRRKITYMRSARVSAFLNMYSALDAGIAQIGLAIDPEQMAYACYVLFAHASAMDLPEDLGERIAILVKDQISVWRETVPERKVG